MACSYQGERATADIGDWLTLRHLLVGRDGVNDLGWTMGLGPEMKEEGGKAFVSDAAKLSLATVAAQGVAVAAAPILGRLFPPAVYGSYATTLTVVTILGVVSCLRLNLAIVLPRDDRDAAALFLGGLITLTIFGAATTLLLWTSAPRIASLLNCRALEAYWPFVPCLVMLSGVNSLLDGWLLRMRCFGTKGLATTSGSVCTCATNIILGLRGLRTVGALMCAGLLGAIATAGLQASGARRSLKAALKDFSGRRVATQVYCYRKFVIFDSWAGLLNTLSVAMAPLLLAHYFSQDTVGQYARSMQLVQLPMVLIGAAIGQVFYQRAANAASREALGELVRRTVSGLIAAGLAPFAFLGVAGVEVFELFLGGDWKQAGLFSQVVSPWCLIVFVGSPVSGLLLVLNKQEINLAFNLGTVVCRAASVAVGGVIGNAHVSIALFSATGCLLWVGLLYYILRLAGGRPAAIIWGSRVVVGGVMVLLALLVLAKYVAGAPSSVVVSLGVLLSVANLVLVARFHPDGSAALIGVLGLLGRRKAS